MDFKGKVQNSKFEFLECCLKYADDPPGGSLHSLATEKFEFRVIVLERIFFDFSEMCSKPEILYLQPEPKPAKPEPARLKPNRTEPNRPNHVYVLHTFCGLLYICFEAKYIKPAFGRFGSVRFGSVSSRPGPVLPVRFRYTGPVLAGS